MYPALALAEELQDHGLQACFLGQAGGPEESSVLRHGFDFYGITAEELKRPLKSQGHWVTLLRLPFFVCHSALVLSRLGPDLVYGTGGHVAFPPCAAAWLLGIPVLTHELNARPAPQPRAAGLPTLDQVMHELSSRTLLSHPAAREGFRHKDRCTVVGTPVRRSLLASAAQGRRKARRALGLGLGLGLAARCGPGPGGPLLVVVLGGSRGCGYLNAAVHNALPQLAAIKGLQLLWQTGAKQHAAYAPGYASRCPSVRVVPFIHDVGQALAAADLVVGRSGPAACAELRAACVPALLVPSPAVCEEQQAANARVLERQGVACVLPQTHVDEFGIVESILDVLQLGPYAPPGRRRRLWPKWLCCGVTGRPASGPGGERSGGCRAPNAPHTLKAMRARCAELRRRQGPASSGGCGSDLELQRQASAGAAEVPPWCAAGVARRVVEQQLALPAAGASIRPRAA